MEKKGPFQTGPLNHPENVSVKKPNGDLKTRAELISELREKGRASEAENLADQIIAGAIVKDSDPLIIGGESSTGGVIDA